MTNNDHIRNKKAARLRPHSSVQTKRVFTMAAACGMAAVAGAAALGPALWANLADASPLLKGIGKAPPGSSAAVIRIAQTSADFAVSDASGKAGEPLQVKISLPPNPSATYSFLMFQGLPAKFTMSAGFSTKHHWAVSLNDISGLRLVPPPGYTGSFPLDVLLVKGKDVEPERRTMKVEFVGDELPPAKAPVTAAVITDRGTTTAAVGAQVLTSARHDDDLDLAQPQAQPQAQQAAPKKVLVAQQMDDDDRFNMERGDALFKQGDVSAARLLYHRMAKKGIAGAAFAMGRTYDPDALKALKVEGLQPDATQARVWYKMAEDLGSREAKSRLLTLRDSN